MGCKEHEHARRVQAAANNVRIDAATAEVLRGFERAGVQAVLLKGPALSPWYGEDVRPYTDCDLWVCPADMEAATNALHQLGFHEHHDESGLPDWWREHASAWSRRQDAVTVDLHRLLQGVGADPQRAWDRLAATTEAIDVAGEPARILASPARALYVVLHAAHHGEKWAKGLVHLDRALSALSELEWREAAELAGQVQAVDAFGAGLRLLPAGARLARRLGLPETRSVKVALAASTPPPVALGFDQIATAGGFSARAQVIARKVIPPPGFIRHWRPRAARNRRSLVVAYLYRPIWLLRHAPAGYRAWRAAMREVRSPKR